MAKVRNSERIELLRSVWLFERCKPKELQAIARLATPVLADSGQVLAREGNWGGEFFVIVEGEAEALIDGASIGILGPGRFFGEMALLDHGPRVATVVARSTMLLLVLSSNEFEELIQRAIPSVSRRMLMVLGERLRQADQRIVDADTPRLAGLDGTVPEPRETVAVKERDADLSSYSGIEVDPVYGPPGSERPGEWPDTRGPHASMYRSKLWTMRMFAGFGTPVDTNRRFKELLSAGGDGLSTAFDLPTLMGRDSDDPLAQGEVGKCGVAVDTLADVADLYRDIDLRAVTTSMTINSPAPVLLAMYVAAAEASGVARVLLGGTLQNDILKEYQAQKEYFFPPRPSMRLVSDVMAFATAELPRWHPISISGYHIREAGSTAAQELAFTIGNGFAYVEAGLHAGLDIDDFAPRLSFFFNAHVDFFEEIAKYRAARRIWARWLRDRYGARSERAMQLRFHTQTAGVSLTAQQPEVNLVRTAIEALAGVLGGTQSLHTNSFDEAFALPTEKAARLALRTQQVIAHETRVANVADPLGGSWYVEELTDEMERRAEAIFAHVEELGGGSMLEGALVGIEEGWYQSEIAQAAYDLERKLNDGRHVIVGVNAFEEGNDEAPPDTLQISRECEEEQLKRLAAVKGDRSAAAVDAALTEVRAVAADTTANIMPALLDAARAYATVGEIMDALADVLGRYREVPTI